MPMKAPQPSDEVWMGVRGIAPKRVFDARVLTLRVVWDKILLHRARTISSSAERNRANCWLVCSDKRVLQIPVMVSVAMAKTRSRHGVHLMR